MDKKIYDALLEQKSNYSYSNRVCKWNEWYFLNDVEIYYNGKVNEDTIKEIEYIKIKQDDYTSAGWSYGKNDCICNGFEIPNSNIEFESSLDLPHGSIGGRNRVNKPSLLIVDKDGKIPLSLNRDRFLTDSLPFNDQLVKSLSDSIFDNLLNTKLSKNKPIDNLFLKHPAFVMHDHYANKTPLGTSSLFKKIIFNKDGFNILNSFTVEKNKISKLVFIEFINENIENDIIAQFFDRFIRQKQTVLLNTGCINPPSYGYSYLFEALANGHLPIDKNFRIYSANIIIPKEAYPKVFNYKNTAVRVPLKDNLITFNEKIKQNRGAMKFEESESSNNFARNYYIKKEESIFDLNELDRYAEDIGLIAEIYINCNGIKNKEVEYYFYNKLEEHFKGKDSFWFPYYQ